MQDQTRRSDPPDRVVVKTDQARQAVTGHNVRYVLAFGLLGAIVAFCVAGYMAGVLG